MESEIAASARRATRPSWRASWRPAPSLDDAFALVRKLIRRAPARYARSFLYTETDANDTTYFILSQLAVIKQAIADLHEYLARKVKEVRATEALLRNRGAVNLNTRQIALLTHALRTPETVLTIEAHAASHKVSYMTGRSDLYALEQLGLLRRTKVGRFYHFHPVEDLADRLKSLR